MSLFSIVTEVRLIRAPNCSHALYTYLRWSCSNRNNFPLNVPHSRNIFEDRSIGELSLAMSAVVRRKAPDRYLCKDAYSKLCPKADPGNIGDN